MVAALNQSVDRRTGLTPLASPISAVSSANRLPNAALRTPYAPSKKAPNEFLDFGEFVEGRDSPPPPARRPPPPAPGKKRPRTFSGFWGVLEGGGTPAPAGGPPGGRGKPQ